MELTCCFFRAKDEYDTNKRLFVDTISDIFYPSNIDNLFHIIFFRAIKQAPYNSGIDTQPGGDDGKMLSHQPKGIFVHGKFYRLQKIVRCDFGHPTADNDTIGIQKVN